MTRTKRSLHPSDIEAMQTQLRGFYLEVRKWAAKTPTGTTAYLAIDVLNHACILMDMQLNAARDNVAYERPPGWGGLER